MPRKRKVGEKRPGSLFPVSESKKTSHERALTPARVLGSFSNRIESVDDDSGSCIINRIQTKYPVFPHFLEE